MAGNVINDKIGDFNLDIKSEVVVDRIENEMQAKFKNVQEATAKRILKRFYKNTKFADVGTNVDEDPVELEKQRLERVIEHLRNDRDNDMRKII